MENSPAPTKFKTEVPTYNFNDFHIDVSKIITGGEGTVYFGRIQPYGQVAIKIYAHDVSPGQMRDPMREVQFLLELGPHPNIVTIYGLVKQQESDGPCQHGYFMEYMSSGSLYNLIHNSSEEYSWVDICRWIEQICSGLQHLHKKSVHRDIKPNNILLVNRDYLKIADFGWACPNSLSTKSSWRGTSVYMAPEVIQSRKYKCSADIYSLTITVWEIIHRTEPYGNRKDQFNVLTEVCNGSTRPTINEMVSPKLRDILNEGWHANPEQRPSPERFSTLISKITAPMEEGHNLRDLWLPEQVSELAMEENDEEDVERTAPVERLQAELIVSRLNQPPGLDPTYPFIRFINHSQQTVIVQRHPQADALRYWVERMLNEVRNHGNCFQYANNEGLAVLTPVQSYVFNTEDCDQYITVYWQPGPGQPIVNACTALLVPIRKTAYISGDHSVIVASA